MKVVILCGGLGTRLREETEFRPKPLVEIGSKPILWHIMKIYSHYGYNEFILCLGYKGYVIKEYFSNYLLHQSDVTIDIKNDKIEVHNNQADPWQVTLIDTGEDTMTGGRVKRIKKYLHNDTFMLTYGDGVGDINIKNLISFHKLHGKLVTVTSSQPKGRFGTIKTDKKNIVRVFQEKPMDNSVWINAGFFVMEPGIFDYIDGDNTILEKQTLSNLTKEGQLVAFKHKGFWKPMDTLRDKVELESLWHSKAPPWKVWSKRET